MWISRLGEYWLKALYGEDWPKRGTWHILRRHAETWFEPAEVS